MPTSGVNAIIEITTQLLASDTPRDFCVNHLTANGGPTVTPANWQALADAIRGFHFATSGTHARWGTNGGSVKVYDRADAKPRPEKAFSNYTPGTWMTIVPDQRQIAMCCSFYSARNLPRKRGRVYLPVNPSFGGTERPDATTQNLVLQYGVQLGALLNGLTPFWQHTVHSSLDDFDWPVDHYWTNDVWDTQRRRKPKENSRVHSP
jgi:hypothetical protein